MKNWFSSLDASSQVMVLGISFLMVGVLLVLAISLGSGTNLGSNWDSSFRLDSQTSTIIDAGGTLDH